MVIAPLAIFLLFQPAGAQDAVGRFMRLRGEIVSPAYEGWWQNEDGGYTLFFGYMNSNWEQEFNVPIGPHNYFTLTEAGGLDNLELEALDPSMADQGQPAHFYPRRNPFLFTVNVPADFGDKEWVWTLTTQGQTKRAYGLLSNDYRMDPQVMSTEVGGNFGSLDDRLRTNMPPELTVEGDQRRSVRAGEPLTLVTFANDPDNYPPRRNRSGTPRTLDELYRTPRGATVQGAPGLRMSWMVYRGPAQHVAFAPTQMKTWMDSRVWANSPWSPPLSIPEPPADGKWVAEVTFEEPGNYVLRAVASDGSRFTYVNVIVTVTERSAP
ncbi:MAG TPA: hypothetical protein DCS76_00775 [Gemmatimonadetes bacterium]|nr:hypothetical protein [Gemmatimonadota bacterium]